MSRRMLTNEELRNEVVEAFSVHYNIPDIEQYIYVNNEQGPSNHKGILGFYLLKDTDVGYPMRDFYSEKVTTGRHITFADVKMHTQKLVNLTTDTLHTVLELICYRERLKGDQVERILCKSPNWRGELLNHPWIKAFYDVNVQYNEKKTHAIATFTNKDPNTKYQCKAYLNFTRAGTRICDPDNYIFRVMEDGPVVTLSINTFFNIAGAVYLNDGEGVLNLPRKGYSPSVKILAYWEILEERNEYIEVDYYQVRLLDDGTVKRTRNNYVASISPSGRPQMKEEIMDTEGTWVEQILHHLDFVKNPNNTHLYEYLEPSEDPYIGQSLFVTALGGIYMKIHETCWLPIEGGIPWLKSHASILPEDLVKEVDRYELAKQLAK